MGLKRNYAWCVFQGTYKISFEEFKTSTQAVINHVFDDHEHCGDWSKTKKMSMEEKIEKKYLFYDKKVDRKLYKQVKDITAPYFSDKSLREVFHKYSTNKCEAIN